MNAFPDRPRRIFGYPGSDEVSRRTFLRLSGLGLGVLATGGLRLRSAANEALEKIAPRADAVLFIYMGGGQASTETWDPKRHTPFAKGMKAGEVFSTFRSAPTSVDGIHFSEGLEQAGSMMHKGTLIPSFKPDFLGVAFHVRHIFNLHTSYKPPQAVAIPSMGAFVARTLGSRHPDVPAYVDIGQRLDLSRITAEVKASHSPGFLGAAYGPFFIPEPGQATSLVRPPAGMSDSRFAERWQRYQRLLKERARRQEDNFKQNEYLEALDATHRLLHSPAAAALDLAQEPAESHAKYNTGRFGLSCLLGRRMIEAGSRFVQVSYEFDPFKHWDTHENGHTRTAQLKKEIDAPLAQLLRDLDERGLLKRTLVFLATEFNRSMLVEGDGGKASEAVKEFDRTGANSTPVVPDAIHEEKHYGLHRHYSNNSTVLMWGGGIGEGKRYGRTSDEPPFPAVEKPVSVSDLHATIYHALGIPANLSYEVEGRPVFLTPDGKGRPVMELFA